MGLLDGSTGQMLAAQQQGAWGSYPAGGQAYQLARLQEYQASTGVCAIAPLYTFAAPPQPEPDTALRWLDRRVDEMRVKL